MRTQRLLLVSLGLVIGCKPPTPPEQIDSIVSWIGTAVMAGDAWLRHTTPDKYTRQTLELASETVGQLTNDLLAARLSRFSKAQMTSVLVRNRSRLARMAALVAAKNAPGFASELDSLRVDQRLVKEFLEPKAQFVARSSSRIVSPK